MTFIKNTYIFFNFKNFLDKLIIFLFKINKKINYKLFN